jgi:hypothetical protein
MSAIVLRRRGWGATIPELVHEFDLHADLAVTDVGGGPFGQRIIYTVTGGELVGDRLKGSFEGAGGDWLLLGADGFGRLDVRFSTKTADGAYMCIGRSLVIGQRNRRGDNGDTEGTMVKILRKLYSLGSELDPDNPLQTYVDQLSRRLRKRSDNSTKL